MRESETQTMQERATDEAVPPLTVSSPGDGVTPTWRPFFAHGYPKKRHSVGALDESVQVRLIPSSSLSRPTLMLGSSVARLPRADQSFHSQHSSPAAAGPSSTGRQRLRRSLSAIPRMSQRRNVTEPTRRDLDDLQGRAQSPPFGQAPISPISAISAFDVDLPSQSPAFDSSPSFAAIKPRFSFRKRESNVQSDPTTLSSDNDTRIFTDDDSMDFQSDTAFDSLATRATTDSHRTPRRQKADTIFLGNALGIHDDEASLVGLMHRQSHVHTDEHAAALSTSNSDARLIAVPHPTEAKDEPQLTQDTSSVLTPLRSSSFQNGQIAMTPEVLTITDRLALSNLDDLEDINWSPESDAERATIRDYDGINPTSALSRSPLHASTAGDSIGTPGSGKRMSIFDWSENQRVADPTKGREIRPKTVHGKQPPETMRSRSSGRKAQNPLHFRSQSVPSSRDPQAEPSPSAASKYGTWGLGHKPVSEEWSDDFEFDDADEFAQEDPPDNNETVVSETRGSQRGVKVPQSIMDRQASVHVQFGQVQEFMLLVEELKRLRAQGLALGLLDSHSRMLWEDAESIINLATINDEDENFELVRPRTSSVMDIFAEDAQSTGSPTNARFSTENQRGQTNSRRSLSGTGFSPHGRPRGDSLAQAKNFLQSIHQSRNGADQSPSSNDGQAVQKLPFDTQDLKDLVVRSGAITRALKDVVRKAEGVSVSPAKTPQTPKDPAFSQIFNNSIDMSPSPPYRKPFLPVS